MGFRRRKRLRTAMRALSNEGMCRHVYARLVTPTTYGGRLNIDIDKLRIEYAHPCGDDCAWLNARRVVMEMGK